ncbi:hypothetical protein AZ044_003443, partial [Pluralibacter gergoviae]
GGVSAEPRRHPLVPRSEYPPAGGASGDGRDGGRRSGARTAAGSPGAAAVDKRDARAARPRAGVSH